MASTPEFVPAIAEDAAANKVAGPDGAEVENPGSEPALTLLGLAPLATDALGITMANGERLLLPVPEKPRGGADEGCGGATADGLKATAVCPTEAALGGAGSGMVPLVTTNVAAEAAGAAAGLAADDNCGIFPDLIKDACSMLKNSCCLA